MHPQFVSALEAGVIPSGILVTVETVLAPYLLSPTVNWSVLLSTIGANFMDGLPATFTAISVAAPQIIESPAWEAKILAAVAAGAAALLEHQATVKA